LTSIPLDKFHVAVPDEPNVTLLNAVVVAPVKFTVSVVEVAVNVTLDAPGMNCPVVAHEPDIEKLFESAIRLPFIEISFAVIVLVAELSGS
jgi:subtilase family serine protease